MKRIIIIYVSVIAIILSIGRNCACAAENERRISPFISQFPIVKEEPKIVKPIEFVAVVEEKKIDVSVYKLSGVVWGAYAPRAVINGKIYSVGDILDEGEIVKIGKEGVTILFNEKKYYIRTKNPFVKIEEDIAETEEDNNENTKESIEEGVSDEEGKGK